MIAAEKALQSLERICASFSSGSLGSLGPVTGSSTNHLQTFGSAFTTIPSVSRRLSIPSPKLPVITTTPSIQGSSLPVLKHRQLVSSAETHTSSIRRNHNSRIPAATRDSLDDLKTGGLHTKHVMCVDGPSPAVPDDVPGRTDKLSSDASHSVSKFTSTYKPTKSIPRSTAGPCIPTSPSLSRHASTLAPLASHVLKREIAEHSFKLHPRRVFGNATIDHGNGPSNKENRNPPVKTVKKRKGMVFVERMQPVAASASSTGDGSHASKSGLHSHREDNKTRISPVQCADVGSTSVPLSTPVKSRRLSLIPVFTPRSSISPPKTYPLPKTNAPSSRTSPSTLRSAATPAKRNMPSPLGVTKNGIRAA